jgi:hypothetical protein
MMTSAGLANAQAASSSAQTPPAASGPEAQIQQSAMAFGQCVSTGVHGVAATVSPEAGASSVLAHCAAQRQQLEQTVEAFIATLPAEQRAEATAQMHAQMGEVESQVAAGIRQQRSQAAAPQAATPQPAGH